MLLWQQDMIAVDLQPIPLDIQQLHYLYWVERACRKCSSSLDIAT